MEKICNFLDIIYNGFKGQIQNEKCHFLFIVILLQHLLLLLFILAFHQQLQLNYEFH
jgi:hypothetical protein